jgi:hypothetical protein
MLACLALVAAAAWLEVLWLSGGDVSSWEMTSGRWLAVAAIVVLAWFCWPPASPANAIARPRVVLLLLASAAIVSVAYLAGATTVAAWMLVVVIWVLLLGLQDLLVVGHRAGQVVVWGLFALMGAGLPVILAQWETRFSEEEFFAALQVAALCVFYLLLRASLVMLRHALLRLPRAGAPIRRRWLMLVLLACAGIGLAGTARAYQQSFYSGLVPEHPGISATDPFVCGVTAPDPAVYDGADVFQRLLRRIEQNPLKGTPEFGMLALGYQERQWAETFQEGLLQEARSGTFTGPAHSVKVGQLHAAMRAYYYPRVRDAFPGLFTPAEEQEIRAWFAAVNRRTLSVEWVDWMYALAFTSWPEGPYQNQENGAGLLALLEVGDLTTPELSRANRDYLQRYQRGWVERFRNTDDAVIYHPEWILNAYFQSLFTGERPVEHVRHSFEWLLLQAKPDGSRLRYNHPYAASNAGVAYLGAVLLGDPRYVWLAGRAVEDVEARDEFLFAQPGVEQALSLEGTSPTDGSCLLYGDSGLPNQAGPLAPDKIVFRDGWSRSAPYALLNLRFTGWHRYKATNTLTLVYHNEPLAGDLLEGEPSAWLPEGRSVFRDKRVPRENLNGLVIEREGISRVLYALTGMGGRWTQDPPFYATVSEFEPGAEHDWSRTVLEDWHGWRHQRDIFFYHGGPLVVVDDASGSGGQDAALVWHVLGRLGSDERRLRLGSREERSELLLLPEDEGYLAVQPELRHQDVPRIQAQYRAPARGNLKLVSVFLFDDWVGAEASLAREGDHLLLGIRQGARQIRLELPR